ncbi:XAC0095 family protein [Luteimonas fraxinea]|uniref:XAC0095-like domain-containing protein n=1 Tax=Luteimonas fraxinea TaxID=2901869 RepID=A0ABS8UE37_9GAMM|nr:hypothetical protein [Luteimonas fraxinea]MCD9097509.1 hypothetical protein [Luteimonas fraxinea]
MGYFLPEDSQFRLKKLREHMDFLSRVSQPRTANEDDEYIPDIRAGEVAVCLELLGEQVELVLDEVTFPAMRKARKARSAAEDTEGDDDDEEEDGAEADKAIGVHAAVADAPVLRFGVTLDQIDALNRLLELISAHGDVVSAGEMADYATQTMPVVGHAIFDHAAKVREILLQVEDQTLDQSSAQNRVREAPAVYGVAPARLHLQHACASKHVQFH